MIFTSLSPNTEIDDILLALKVLVSPWLWKKGRAVKDLENIFKQWLGTKYVFAFESGRTSLYAILSCLGLQKGDEVLLQAYTCLAVPNAVVWAGLKPIYADCQKNLTMSVEDLKKKITSKSKVLIIQHTFGQPADIEELLAAAKKNNLFVIEDCAHSLGSRHKEKKLGSFGDASFFSFGRDKVISSVFGGLLATNNQALARKIESLKNSFDEPKRLWVVKQLLHPLFLAIAKSTYGFFSLGKIFLEILKQLSLISKAIEPTEKQGGRPSFAFKKMPNALAILALRQFKKLERFNAHRQKISRLYENGLKNLGITLPQEKNNSLCIFLRYPVLINNPKAVLRAAKKEGVELGDWYLSPIAPLGVNYEKIFYQPGSCPMAEKLASQSINLPTHIQIKEKDALKIIDFLKGAAGAAPAGAKILMSINIQPINSKIIWENFIQECRPGTFLHAWNWGEFHQQMNYKIWRLGVSADNNLAGIALLIKIKARRGAFLFCPHGPLLKETLVLGERLPKQKILKTLLEIFKKIALSEKCRFIRVSPLMEDSKENKLIFKNLGFRKAPIHIHPELVWLLDIAPNENELLKRMRKTTRYSIKKAEKDGVAVIKSSKIDDLEIFWQLYRQTASRHHFTPFSKQYLQKEFEVFQKDEQALLLFGRYKDEIISGALIIFYGGIGFYHHGASLPKYTQITASHLLQWEAIKEAKKKGCRLYNFWGLAPSNNLKHPWAGLSLFKKGFGGFSQSYLLTQDFIISPLYWLTFAIEKVRKIKRGF